MILTRGFYPRFKNLCDKVHNIYLIKPIVDNSIELNIVVSLVYKYHTRSGKVNKVHNNKKRLKEENLKELGINTQNNFKRKPEFQSNSSYKFELVYYKIICEN